MKANIGIIELLKIVDSLRKQYPHKRFTLDGRLVGDLGEVIAEENYQLKLYDKVVEKYDAETYDNKLVQIKATFHDTLGFPCNENYVPELYLGIKILPDGSYSEIYNGPGLLIWENVRHYKIPKNNLYSIQINKLTELNQSVSNMDRIKRKT